MSGSPQKKKSGYVRHEFGQDRIIGCSIAVSRIRHDQTPTTHSIQYISNQKVSSVVTGDAAACLGVTWPRQISRRHVSTTAYWPLQ